MAALKFANSHNMVAFLDKPTKSDGFEQIVDFLNARPIKYSLMVNPTIYTSLDKKKVIVTEASVRRDLQLADENGTECLPNATIFAELKRMGYEQEFKDNQVKESPKPQKISDTPQSHNQEYTTDSHHTPATTQPSTSKPQKKQSRRKQRKDTEDPQLSGPTEPVTDDTENVASVPTHSNDPLLQKKRVEEAGKEKKSKPLGMKRLFKIGRSAQVVSSEDEGILYGEEVFTEQDVVEKEVSTAEVATTITVDELTLAQTLIEIKAAKPKARGVIVQEPSEFTTTTSPTQPSQLPHAKDKGKAKMVEPEKPLKKKDQIMFDKEVAQKLQAQLDAELEEEEKLARQREEDANIAEWDNVQAMMDADYELAARLQA
ncbi:hypothetical protein Tco_0820283 [Tanacetum coccineum]|uniref:Uncharacterized protein n=1 Tax=Tanacetum coccineum TaxID=301880 RepID=A0ABQ5AD86_9ASTR